MFCCEQDICLCGINVLWALAFGIFIGGALYYGILNMSFRDIHKALDSVPEDVRWVSCLFATAGALYAYKTEVLSIAAMVGLTEHVMPYAFGGCVLVMLLVRGSLARSRGHPLIPDFLLEGLGPLAFMGLVGGFATLEFLALARRADGGLKSWTGLVVVSLVSGFFSHRGAKYAAGEPFLPHTMLAGHFPFLFMCVFGASTVYEFYAHTAVQGAALSDWIPLVLLCFFSGALSWWGVSFAHGHDFIHVRLTTGKFPVAFFGAVGSYVLYEFLHLAAQSGNGLRDWLGLIILSGLSGYLSWYGYKMQKTAADQKK
mmetsp:Transcript_5600/g.9165  ORF Transcript_5600/g.9165 Transcript_5600/m.9165 type:complete len:314 (-) Transcript_5600:1009-1950(-)